MPEHKLKIIKYDRRISKKILFYLNSNQSSSFLIPPNLSYLNENILYTFDGNIEQIEKKYREGYRVFIAIASTNEIINLLPWFKLHKDAYLICGTSTSSNSIILDRNMKNVYRMPVHSYYFAPIYTDMFYELNNNEKKKLYLIGVEGYDYSIHLISKIEQIIDKTRFASINTVFIKNSNELISLVEIVTSSNDYISGIFLTTNLKEILYNTLSNSPPYGYFVEYYSNISVLSDIVQNRYFYILYEPPYERNVAKLNNNLYITNSFSPIIDCINMSKNLVKYGNINKTIGSYGYLYFNDNMDRNFVYFTVYNFTSLGWNIIHQYFNLNQVFIKTKLSNAININNVENSLLYTYNYRKTKKGKICFLLLDSIKDNDIKINLQILGYRFDIYNIVGKSTKFLEKLYRKNYRIFIGCNTSSSLINFKPFFDMHNDCVLISMYSTIDSLTNRNNINIYRMIPPDNVSYVYYVDFIFTNNPAKVNFIVQMGDQYSESLYENMNKILREKGYSNIEKLDVSINSSSQDYDNIILQTNKIGYISQICALNDNIFKNIYGRLDNNVGIYLDGGSTTPRTPIQIIPSTAKNCYFLMFNPPFERNIQLQIDLLKNKVALPLIDSIMMAKYIQKYGTFDNMIGSYGYTYFTANGDKNFVFYALRLYDGKDWIIHTVYNVLKNNQYKSYPLPL